MTDQTPVPESLIDAVADRLAVAGLAGMHVRVLASDLLAHSLPAHEAMVRAKVAEEIEAKAAELLAEAKRLTNTGNGEVVIDLKDTAADLQNAAALVRGEQPAGVEALLTYAASLGRGGQA